MKAALFDLDGVLIDTEPIYTRIWEEIERKYPTSVTDFALVIKGNTLPNILNTYFSPSDHEAIINMLHNYEDEMEYPLFPSTIPFLQKLKNAGIPTAIVTSSGDRKMEKLFHRYPLLGESISTLVTDSQVVKGKPAPDCYLLAASRLGVNPEECVVFEDSINGLKSGQAARCTLVALATTNPEDKLLPFTDLVVTDLADERVATLFDF